MSTYSNYRLLSEYQTSIKKKPGSSKNAQVFRVVTKRTQDEGWAGLSDCYRLDLDCVEALISRQWCYWGWWNFKRCGRVHRSSLWHFAHFVPCLFFISSLVPSWPPQVSVWGTVSPAPHYNILPHCGHRNNGAGWLWTKTSATVSQNKSVL